MSSRSDLPAHRRAAIAGLGMTEMGKVYGRTAQQFAAEAVRRAVADAGLRLGDVDGLLVSAGLAGGVDLSLQDDLGLEDLRLLSQMQSFGSTAGAMVQHAAMAVEADMADTVVCVFADAPLREGTSTGAAYAADRYAPKGWGGMVASSGFTGPNSFYALAARRHMQAYGTTSK
jgi:acetyl-CoA acetyltransferase